ncbi:MAG: hypothetical protein AAFN78_02955, partial [Pseudomonadota bacterium]
MSFILDALKKAEHARPPASMPQMPAVPVAATGLEKRRQAPAWLLAAGGAVVALVVAAIAWQLLGSASTEQATAATARPVSTAPPAGAAAAPTVPQPLAEEPRRAEVRPLNSEAKAGQPEPAVIAPTARVSPSLPQSSGSRGPVTPGTVVYEDLSNEPPVQRGTVQYQRNFANEPAPAAQPAPSASSPSPSSTN